MANSVIPNNIIVKSYMYRDIPITYETGGGIYRVGSDGYAIGLNGYQVAGITISEEWGTIHNIVIPYIQNVVRGSETVNFMCNISETIEGLTIRVLYRRC